MKRAVEEGDGGECDRLAVGVEGLVGRLGHGAGIGHHEESESVGVAVGWVGAILKLPEIGSAVGLSADAGLTLSLRAMMGGCPEVIIFAVSSPPGFHGPKNERNKRSCIL